MNIYVVEPGDDVDGISAKYGVPAGRVISDNQLIYPYDLAVGQALLIRDGMTAEAGNPEQWLCLSFYQSVGFGTDTSVSDRVVGLFLWFYCRRRACRSSAR